MKHLLITVALYASATLLVSAPALAKKNRAQDIDFGAITCGEFMQELSTSSSDEAGVVLMWIDGYLSGVSGDTTLDWEGLEEFSAGLVDYCSSQPGARVLDAAEEIGISE